MTFLQLARRNALRRPVRTLLLVLSIATAFLVYGLTASFLAGAQGGAGASDELLGVFNKVARDQPLPLAHLARIEASPDVAGVAYMTRLRGFSGAERNVVAVNAFDPHRLATVNGGELGITPSLVAALEERRDAVLVGRALASAQGWTVGRRVEITAFGTAKADGSRSWSFDVAGIFEGADPAADTYFMIARYDYVDAARARDKGTVDGFVVRPRAGVSPASLAGQIDELFANSAAPTRTQPEKQFLEAFLRQYADVGLIVDLVVGAAFVTILMIVANTMLFAVRERTFEIGVLKTLGFSRARILALVLYETFLVFAVGGALGLALSKLATVLAGPALGLAFTSVVLLKAVLILVALALATGLLPAVQAMRTSITHAFRAR